MLQDQNMMNGRKRLNVVTEAKILGLEAAAAFFHNLTYRTKRLRLRAGDLKSVSLNRRSRYNDPASAFRVDGRVQKLVE